MPARRASKTTNLSTLATDGASSKSADGPTEADLPTIAYVILGRLAQTNGTGYDLSAFMGPPRNYIWDASHSQIYPLLALLKRLGLVSFKEVTQTGKPNKKVYSITAQGKRALQNWVRSSPTPMIRRLEFNAKVNSLWTLPPEEALEVLQQQIDMTRAELQMIEGHMNDSEARDGLEFPPPPGSKYSGIYANIRYAIGSRNYMIKWYRSIQKEFEALVKAQSTDSAAKKS